ncbi:signal peptidase II [Cohnella mopanensis]|uniref:signal peptidase II n=1 Tax=Cohnella mopanensis TaxID=2911966 RepID=UPI001EF8BCD5|nr:signal peptidase II [Cohnella mopanensis]
MLFYAIALFIVLVDQVTKILVRIHVDVGENISLWGIRFTHYENSGMASSLFQGYGRLFGVIAMMFVIGVLYYRRSGTRKGVMMECSLGFIVGGAIGNGVDRLIYGEVTDFIIRSGGILNVADHAIELGVLLLLIYFVVDYIGKRKASRG